MCRHTRSKHSRDSLPSLRKERNALRSVCRPRLLHPWESNPRPTPFWCRLSVGASHAIPPLRAFPLTACLSVHYVPYMIFCRCHAAPHGTFARPFHTVPLRLMSVLCRSIVTLCISTAMPHVTLALIHITRPHFTIAFAERNNTKPLHRIIPHNFTFALLIVAWLNKPMPSLLITKLCLC